MFGVVHEESGARLVLLGTAYERQLQITREKK
jgi:hypothetical protein